MPGVEIRRATEADAEQLARLRGASAFERKGGDERSRDAYVRTCATFFARELANPQSFLRSWLAIRSGEAVGSASLTVVQTLPRYGARAYSGFDGRVRDVFVLSQMRRRGIARQLMHAVLGCARAERVDRLSLGSTQIGMPLYLALGFEPKRDEMIYAYGLD